VAGLAEPGVEVVEVDGDHSLKADPAAVGQAVAAWLAGRSYAGRMT